MASDSGKKTFNRIMAVVALGILFVVVMIVQEQLFKTGLVKKTGVSASLPSPASKQPAPDQNPSFEGSGRPNFALTPRRLETQTPENGTDPIADRLNREGIAYYTLGDFFEAVKIFEQAFERDNRSLPIRHNLAHAKGSLGWTQFDNRHYNDALLIFQEALQLKEEEPFFWLGQGLAYFRLNDTTRAIKSLKKTIELDPPLPEPYKVLGNIYYQQDEMEMAVGYLELALKRDPRDENLKTQLAKARREHITETGFQRRENQTFTVKYEGREEGETARRVLENLDSAYRDIGKMLSYFPEDSITVILYTEKQFQDVTQTPDWTSGLFDGKIRIPVSGAEENPDLLREVLYHEYTHALVFQLTGGAPVPRWLDEGLAEYFESKDTESKKETFLFRIRNGQKPFPLSELHGSFLGLPANQAGLVYSQSFSAVYSLIDRYGIYRIRLLLDDLQTGKDFETAFFDQFMIPYERFQEEWEEEVYGESL